MTLDQLQAFLSKVHNDAGLKAKLNAPGADIVAIAKEAGFTITAESVKNMANPDWLMKGADSQAMEALAGGASAASGGGTAATTTCWTQYCTCMSTCRKDSGTKCIG